jgi:hypothetical protein
VSTAGTHPDVVYVLGPGHQHEELRYSLRSLRNLPHGQVWIVGAELPKWVIGVRHVFHPQAGSRYKNSTENLRIACSNSEISEVFTLMNDDFFIMKPVEKTPVHHRGPTAEVIRRLGWADMRYMAGMRQVMQMCQRLGIVNPLCYETHTPIPVDKQAMLRVLTRREADHLPLQQHKRTLYGNLAALGGEQIADPKVIARAGGFRKDAIYLSTAQWNASEVVGFIKESLPGPSPYERVN